MIYLYAITEADAIVPACSGLDDAPLALVRASGVAGLYSSHERVEAKPRPDALWRHEQVVEAAMEAGPALPSRFGTTFADQRALATALERYAQTLTEQLERLRGCVELAVRVGFRDVTTPSSTSGRAYVEAKVARRRRHHAVVAQTLAPLSELATRGRTDEGRAEPDEICASYLVPADWVEPFAQAVRTLADRNPKLILSCTGPWPPYSFVELEAVA